MEAQVVEEHYRKNYNTLVKKFTRWAGSVENAEDVVQIAYTRALTYFRAYDPSQSFHSWFSRILNNSLKTFKAQERGAVFEEYVEEEQRDYEDPLYDKLLSKKIIMEINKYGNQDTREILRLHFRDGLPPRDIVKILDIKKKAVSVCLYRFKEFIKNKYGTDS